MKPPCTKCVDYEGAACDWCKRNDYRAFRGIETLATSTPVWTNYDRLISKTPEEMAKFLHDMTLISQEIGLSVEWWEQWLKSPVEEGSRED